MERPPVALDGMRQGVDADADLADLPGLLEHLGSDTGRLQGERGRHPANPATDNQDFSSFYLQECHLRWSFPGHPGER
jgi:hypothetical protein